jgi:hypothetical protein
MTVFNEDENPLLGTNDRIAEILASNYGEQVIEELRVLLSEPGFAADIQRLQKRFRIIPLSTLKDSHVQQYIADAVCRKEHDLPEGVTVEDIQLFVKSITRFNKLLGGILVKHTVDERWLWPLTVHIAKGNVTALASVRNMITVSMDKKTKDLTIRIKSDSRSKEDLISAADSIYKSWNHLRQRPAKRQPSNYAERDSSIAIYKTNHSYSETAEHFRLDVDSVKKIVKRLRVKREQIR